MAGSSIFSGGKGLFTAHDPASALRANPPPTWVAVLPDKVTPELAASFKQAGIALVIWEPQASQAGVDAVRQYGAAGYIAQAEGPEQLAAALQFGSQVAVPKALVTNLYMNTWPPGWIAMPEAYTNNDPNATPDQMTRDAFARGATEVVPVIGIGFVDTPDGRRMTAAEYQAGLDRAGAAGASGSAAYLAEQVSPEELSAYTSGKTPSGTGGQTRAEPPGGGGGAAQSGQTQTTPTTTTTTPTQAPTPKAPDTDPLYGGENAMPGGGFEGPADLPPPPYGMPKGPQQAEGELGENWNLGWLPPQQHASSNATGPRTAPTPTTAPAPTQQPGAAPGAQPTGSGLAGAGAGFAPGSQPPGVPGIQPSLIPSPYLTPQALHQIFQNLPYLNKALATNPPYRRYGF